MLQLSLLKTENGSLLNILFLVVLSSAMEDNKEKLAARAIVDIDYTTLLFCTSKIHVLYMYYTDL